MSRLYPNFGHEIEEAIHVLCGMQGMLANSSGIAIIEVHNHDESHGVYIYTQRFGWRLKETWNEHASGDKYHAHKVFVK